MGGRNLLHNGGWRRSLPVNYKLAEFLVSFGDYLTSMMFSFVYKKSVDLNEVLRISLTCLELLIITHRHTHTQETHSVLVRDGRQA